MSDRLLKESDVIAVCYVLPKLYSEAIKLFIKRLPSADRPQGKWRDVTDELPKQGQDVLAWVETKDDARIACCNYSNSIWFDAIMDVIVSPIAWMPLPMPYHKDERSE